MLTDYFPILVFLGVGIGMGAVLLAVGAISGPRNPSDEKNSAYECGFEAFEDSTFASISSLFCSSFSTWKLPSCFHGQSCLIL